MHSSLMGCSVNQPGILSIFCYFFMKNVKLVVHNILFLHPLLLLQVVRLASFQHAPSIPPFIVPKQSKLDGDDSVFQKELDDRRYAEVAVAGGGVSVAVTRFPPEQKRPIGPLVVVGVRDGVLWLVDR